MTESSRLFFTGNTLEQAVMAGSRHYGVEPDELAYEKVERKTGSGLRKGGAQDRFSSWSQESRDPSGSRESGSCGGSYA
jgi:hypothetical protein